MWPPLYGGGFWVAFAQAATVYYTAATTLHYIVPAVTQVRSVQKGHPAQGQVTREAFASLCPLAVKAAVWTITERLHAAGYGLLYDGPIKSLQAIAYLVFTIIALDYLHDAWFYWTHRLLHWAPVYRHVHYIHHKSTVPTAFAGYSFHSAEAALVFANEILVCFLFPVHMGLHRLYHIFTTLIHNGGHAGYEIAPFIPSVEALIAMAARLFLGSDDHAALPPSALNTVRHHDMHHRHPKVHFSLYMTHWDRIMGTEHPDYTAAVARHFHAR